MIIMLQHNKSGVRYANTLKSNRRKECSIKAVPEKAVPEKAVPETDYINLGQLVYFR